MGTVGATFYVIGVGLLYSMTGSLNMADIAARLGPAWAEHRGRSLAALAFVTRRHRPEARAVPAPCVAAERLHLRARRR